MERARTPPAPSGLSSSQSPPNSKSTWRHAPQGAQGASSSGPTTAMAR